MFQRVATCDRYGPANYTSDSVHPPLWGFSLDGYSIYGRHLSVNNDGCCIRPFGSMRAW